MTASARPTALIVGAGIGGLAAATALRQGGWNVTLFERASSPRELGFDLMLASNAMLALRELGVAKRVLDAGRRVDSVTIQTARGGRLRRFDLSPVPASLRPIILSRQALHGVLIGAVGVDAITFQAEASQFHVGHASVALELRDGRRFDGTALIGADGIGSVIRQRLYPDATPRPRLVGLRGVAYGVEHLVDASLALALVPGADSGLIRGREGAVYWFVSARGDVVDTRTHDATWMIEKYVDMFDEPLRSVARATREDEMRIEHLADADPLARWGNGPVTLLGDAAHPMLPHAGQGAAQALEDAVALGVALGPGGDPVRGLRRYEAVRSPRTARVVRLSRRLSRLRTSRNPLVAILRTAAVQATPAAALHLVRLFPHETFE